MSVRKFATVVSNIGEKKVAMSNFEQDKYINYQRIADNLEIVKKRYVDPFGTTFKHALMP